MDKKRRSSAVLLALVLLATGFTAQAQTTYGPIRPGENLWDIAKHIYPDQGVTADQVMLALLRANPQAFGYPCNANAALHRGFVLQVPALAEVKVLSREDAQREFGRQLQEWEDHLRTGKPFVCPPVGPPVSEVAPALSQAGAATPPPAAPAERAQDEAPTAPATPVAAPPEQSQAEVPAALPATTPMHAEPSQAAAPTTPVGTTAVPSGQPATKAEGAQPPEGATPPPHAAPPEQSQAEVPAALPATTPMHAEPSQAAAPTTPVGTTAVPSGQPATKAEGAQPPEGATPPPHAAPPEQSQAEVPAALPATTPMHAEPSQAAAPTTPVGTTAVPSGQPATKAEGAQPPEGATPPPQWQRLWARITPYLGFGWLAIPIVVALIAGIVFWRYRRAPAKAPPAPVATSPQPTAPDLPPTDRA